jgi:hypothetical protein
MRAALPFVRSSKAQAYDRNLRACLSAGLKEVVSKFPTVEWENVGVHAFLVRGTWPFLRLVNIGGIRLSGTPSMTRPVWRRGKGVVGIAWREEKFVAVDWESFYTTANRLGPEAWRHHPDKYGLPAVAGQAGEPRVETLSGMRAWLGGSAGTVQ